jgi:hypothetical protein
VVSFNGGGNSNIHRKEPNNCKLLDKSHHIKDMFEDSKMEIRSRKLKDRQDNGQLKKYTLRVLEQHLSGTPNVKRLGSQIIQNPNNLNMVEIRCSGRVNSSCSSSRIHGKRI